MLPIGPLMKEHRIIEQVIARMRRELDEMRATRKADTAFIDTAVDFIRTYADRCHHGKEEDILFAQLEEKPLDAEERKTIEQLKQEHVYGREVVGRLVQARTEYASGREDGLGGILDCFESLVNFYPGHIDTEDNHFFRPVMEYFSEEEREAMLEAFRDFDASLIHERYRGIADEIAEKDGAREETA